MEGHRSERVAEALREELSELIGYELSDPRIGTVTVTEVHLDPGMKHAHVRLALPADSASRDEALKVLDHARHFLRRQLAIRLSIYRIPELHFEPDVAADLNGRLDHLLKRVRKGRPKDQQA